MRRKGGFALFPRAWKTMALGPITPNRESGVIWDRTIPQEVYAMKSSRATAVVLTMMLALSTTFARAADRVHPGLWEITIGDGALGKVTRSCVTAAHAVVANLDDKAFQEHLAKPSGENGCVVKDVKVSGNQVTIDAVCDGQQNVISTTYHGESYDQVNSNGMKVRAKRIGACP